MTVYHGTGCSICSNSGYKGRVALYEVMPISEKIRDLVLQGRRQSQRVAAETAGIVHPRCGLGGR